MKLWLRAVLARCAVHVDWTEVLVNVVVGLFSYLGGHRRGRAVYRSGDYLDKRRDVVE